MADGEMSSATAQMVVGDCFVLTIGMATYRDFEGVWATIKALQLYHPRVEYVLVDNDIEPCRQSQGAVESAGGRYFYRPDLCGTSKPRDHVFKVAETEWVCCIDCHVFLIPGAVRALIDYAISHPNSRDILSGPIIADNGNLLATHWQPDSSCGLWGQWSIDPHFYDPRQEPFEIPMQGLGLFAMRKAAWPGFNPLFRGFGGEEGYIHEKVRQRGGKALCLPQLGWWHRFRDQTSTKGIAPYPLKIEDHTFNLLVGHRELGIEAEDKIFEHFGKRVHSLNWMHIVAESRAKQPFGESFTLNSREN